MFVNPVLIRGIFKGFVYRAKKLCSEKYLDKNLRILAGKKHRQMKLQRLQKVQIWAFGLLVQQINSLLEVLQLKQNFLKNKVVTGKTTFFVIGPFYLS